MLRKISHSEQETRDLGRTLPATLQGGDIVLLKGELGTGKTTLTKGIAEGLGIQEEITSPTFTLMNVYKIKNYLSNLKGEIKNLVHIDTYRLKNEDELLAIGAEDYLGALDTICIIEWPEKIENLLRAKKVKKIFLKHDKNDKRILSLDIL